MLSGDRDAAQQRFKVTAGCWSLKASLTLAGMWDVAVHCVQRAAIGAVAHVCASGGKIFAGGQWLRSGVSWGPSFKEAAPLCGSNMLLAVLCSA